MKNVLVVNKVQFGYHTDVYKWCIYLRHKYNVSEITLDMGKPKCKLDNVDVTYVPSTGSRIFRAARYILTVLFRLLFFKGVIIVCYFPGCEIFKRILPWKKMILDIRTLDVSKEDEVREREDRKILRACHFYDFVTVISSGLRDKMKLSKEMSAVLPLGADVIQTKPKEYSKCLRLLYVGTFTNRNIDDTIRGFAKAYTLLHDNVELHYDIIGRGFDGEHERYEELIHELNMEDAITLHGYIQHDRLYEYYESCNIGVSYVPITDYYEHQPVTKTFEYALAGLFTIATGTLENKKVITEKNGVIIDDSAESFMNAIIFTYHNDSICYEDIKSSLLCHEWSLLVETQMYPVIDKFIYKFKL